ncbi:MAG: CBS domain-containing protein [Novosphingobium sp.]
MTIGRMIRERTREVISCDASLPLGEAVSLLAGQRIGALPVLDDGRVAGIFSERDVIHQLDADGPAILERTVGEVMTAPAITVTPETTVLEALGLMTRRRIRHLPVVEGDRIVDFVSIGDLVKYRIDHIQTEAEALRSYIQSA